MMPNVLEKWWTMIPNVEECWTSPSSLLLFALTLAKKKDSKHTADLQARGRKGASAGKRDKILLVT